MGFTGAANNRFYNVPIGPLPTEAPNVLFAPADGAIVGPVQFTWPSFPVNSRPGAQPEPIFWNGKARKDDNGDGRPDFEDSRIFYAQYAQNGNVTSVSWINRDPTMEKKRIRPLNTGNVSDMGIFWYGETNGITKMYHNVTGSFGYGNDQTPNWSDNILIDPGRGFASARDPQPILRTGGVALVFTGQLRDRPQPEIFYAHFDANRFGQLGRLEEQPERVLEPLVREGTTGTYRARGVNWDDDEPIQVFAYRPGGTVTRIDNAGGRTTDPNTGVISVDSRLGGRVFLDPHVGTVRFTTPPSGDLTIALRYTPRVVRVSELGNTGGHSNPSSFLDMRPQWDRNFYRNRNNSAIQAGDIPLATRLTHFYERGATGAGQNRRPYMKSQRLRVQLPTPVLLQDNQIVNLTVSNMNGAFYQVDPANGRVYFEIPDEGNQVTISYTYQDANGNQQVALVQETVSWGTEMSEQPVPIEQAIDEGTIFAFPDPFVWSQGDPRPGLIWIMYTSTRNGTRDVFYQSMAPRWMPRPQ